MQNDLEKWCKVIDKCAKLLHCDVAGKQCICNTFPTDWDFDKRAANKTYTFEEPVHCHGLINNIDTYAANGMHVCKRTPDIDYYKECDMRLGYNLTPYFDELIPIFKMVGLSMQ
ncbi:hypothetical protein WR25_16920 [Diploscapter pachys]|uniref:Uncharacterized protein n=1 Tax=Diploscapter pachys TaxID=2018661 RepID=A0A2A2LKB9_9BILA|nr:hypothetical protein WR25_16920 [Diploscapter pachys]